MRICRIGEIFPKLQLGMCALLFLFLDSVFYENNFEVFALIDTILLVLSTLSALSVFIITRINKSIKGWSTTTILSFKSIILLNILTEIAMRAHVESYEGIYKAVFLIFIIESFIFSNKTD